MSIFFSDISVFYRQYSYTFDHQRELVWDDWLHEVVEVTRVDSCLGFRDALQQQPVTLATVYHYQSITKYGRSLPSVIATAHHWAVSTCVPTTESIFKTDRQNTNRATHSHFYLIMALFYMCSDLLTYLLQFHSYQSCSFVSSKRFQIKQSFTNETDKSQP